MKRGANLVGENTGGKVIKEDSLVSNLLLNVFNIKYLSQDMDVSRNSKRCTLLKSQL